MTPFSQNSKTCRSSSGLGQAQLWQSKPSFLFTFSQSAKAPRETGLAKGEVKAFGQRPHSRGHAMRLTQGRAVRFFRRLRAGLRSLCGSFISRMLHAQATTMSEQWKLTRYSTTKNNLAARWITTSSPQPGGEHDSSRADARRESCRASRDRNTSADERARYTSSSRTRWWCRLRYPAGRTAPGAT